MNKISINNIYIKNNIIIAELNIRGNSEIITTQVSSNAIKYASVDRIDALVIGLIIFAIKNKYDFESQIPISEELYYNITHHFIRTITTTENLYRPQIFAPIISEINNKSEIIATGISCGVDSLYTIYSHKDLPSNLKINHLIYLDAGSHKTGNRVKDEELFNGRRQLCINFAKKAQLNLIEIYTNMHEIINKYDLNGYSHVENHTFMTASCITWLQSGIKRYYYSSGIPYYNFNCKYHPDGKFDAASYDLLSLNTFSHGSIKFISSGGNISRIEKVKELCNYELAHKYLNVCINSVKNDSVCYKCARTLLEIDACGKIDLFRDVFDIDFYKNNRQKYLELLYINYLKKDQFAMELFPYYKNEFTIKLKFLSIYNKIINIIKNRLHR